MYIGPMFSLGENNTASDVVKGLHGTKKLGFVRTSSNPTGSPLVATIQLRLALETEEERGARLEHLSDNPVYIPNNFYLILIVKVSSLIKLTRSIPFFRTIHNI